LGWGGVCGGVFGFCACTGRGGYGEMGMFQVATVIDTSADPRPHRIMTSTIRKKEKQARGEGVNKKTSGGTGETVTTQEKNTVALSVERVNRGGSG